MGGSPNVLSLLRPLLFFATVLLVVGGGHLYLYRRLVRDTTRRMGLRRLGGGVLLGLALGLVFARVAAALFHSYSGETLVFISWCWMGFGLYLGISLAVLRGARRMRARFTKSAAAAESPERRQFLARVAAGTAVASSSLVSGYGVWRAFEEPVLSELALVLPNLPRALDGLSIVQLSDVHIGTVLRRKFLEEAVARCNRLKPDLVAITGDLVDGSVPELLPIVSALQNLKSRYGTFFCTGNHEFYSGDVAWAAALERLGLTVLRNRFVRVGDAGASFDLVGVDDWGHKDSPEDHGYDLAQALQGRDPGRASVLLAHQPAGFKNAAQAGVGLQLSGHTHGGQFFPFTALLGGIAALRLGVAPYTHGLYQEGASRLYVHRGCGFWGPPMRVGSRPEIVKLTLMAG